VFNSVDLSLGEFESARMGKRRDNTRYAAAQVALNLEEAIASLPEFEGAEVLELLRFVPGSRGLFSGALRGRPVVFRVFLGPDAQGDAAKEWAELTRAWAYMRGPDFFVPEPLGYAEGQWFYAMQQVSGALLLRHIARQDPEEQLRLIGRAGEWYAAYIAPTQVSGKARPTRWLNLAEKAMLAQPHPSLARLEVGIYAEAKRLADRLSKGKWHSAICHGDFHLNNLFIRQDVLTGFDLGGREHPLWRKTLRGLWCIWRGAGFYLRVSGGSEWMRAPMPEWRRRCRRPIGPWRCLFSLPLMRWRGLSN
jgi:hypothetical protein